MISVDWAIAALLEKQATVESVAKTVGTLEGKRSVGFEVRPSAPSVSEIVIGAKGDEAKSAVPDYVDFHFDLKQTPPISELSETCSQWKSVPNTPRGSPFVYGCQAKASTPQISVKVLVTLSDDIDSPQARIVRVLLQRGVW